MPRKKKIKKFKISKKTITSPQKVSVEKNTLSVPLTTPVVQELPLVNVSSTPTNEDPFSHTPPVISPPEQIIQPSPQITPPIQPASIPSLQSQQIPNQNISQASPEVSIPQPDSSSISSPQLPQTEKWDEEASSFKKPWILILGIILLILVLGGVGYFFWIGKDKSLHVAKTVPTVNAQVTIKETKTTTIPTGFIVQPTGTIAIYSIKVLNGSGVAGTAAAAKEILTTAGFKVSSIDNADASNFTKTVISVKTNIEAKFVQKLQDTLSMTYVVSPVTTPLGNSADSDVVVIIGSSKK